MKPTAILRKNTERVGLLTPRLLSSLLLLCTARAVSYGQEGSATATNYVDVVTSTATARTRSSARPIRLGLHIPTCICCCQPCPCDGPVTDLILGINTRDIISSAPLRLQDSKGHNLYVVRLKRTEARVYQNANTYEWVGAAHNATLGLIMPTIEKAFIQWKSTNHKPSKAELNALVKRATQKALQDVGFTGSLLSGMTSIVNRLTNSTLDNRFASTRTGVLNRTTIATYQVKAPVVSYYGLLETQLNRASAATALQANARSNRAEASKLQPNFADFASAVSATSVAENSAAYWAKQLSKSIKNIEKGTGTPPSTSTSVAKGAKDVVKQDAGGAVVGGAAGSVAPGVGTVGGAVAGGITASTVEAVIQFLDLFF